MQRMSVAAGSTLRFYTQQCLARSHAVCLPAARMASTRTVQPGASAIFVGGECRREGSAGSAGASVHARRLGTTAVHGARRKPQRRAAVVEPDEPDEPDFLMDEREAYGGIESEGGGDGPPLTALESMAHQAVQDFTEDKITFEELEKILATAGVDLGGESDHDDDDDHDDPHYAEGQEPQRTDDNDDYRDVLGGRRRTPQSQAARAAAAAERVLDDPDILAAFDRGDGDGDEDETSSRQPQRAEVQQLITFRLGRMPDTVVQPGASGMAAEGMDARGKVRSRRIGGSIQKALVEGLRRGQLGHALQRFRLEIDEVELSGGLRTATIWWHSQGAEIDAQIKAEVELLRGKPRTLIARALNLKFTPQVRWKPTTVRDSSTELDSLFALVETEMDDAKDRGVV